MGTSKTLDQLQTVPGGVIAPGDWMFLTRGTNDYKIAGSNFTGAGGGGGISEATGNLLYYPLATNPSGYITGVDLSSYALTSTLNATGAALEAEIDGLQAATGGYITSGNLVGRFVTLTGNEVITGNKIFYDGAGVIIGDFGNRIFYDSGGETSLTLTERTAYGLEGVLSLDWQYRIAFDTEENVAINWSGRQLSGNWLTNTSPTVSQHVINKGYFDTQTGTLTGQFYPRGTNPSGYITGVDLSPYVLASETGVFLVSADLANYALTSALNATGAALEGEIDALQAATGSYYPRSNPSGFATTGFTNANYVRLSGNEQVTGNKYFFDALGRPAFDVAARIIYGTSDSYVDANTAVLAFNTTQSIDWQYKIAYDNSEYVSIDWENRILSGDWRTNATPTVSQHLINKGYLDTQTGTLTGQFYPRGANPSGYITGVDLTAYALTSALNATGAALEAEIDALESQTGSYYPISNPNNYISLAYTQALTGQLTGAFYPRNSNPSGYLPSGNVVGLGSVSVYALETGSTLGISGAGEVNTASNLGGGLGVYSAKTGVNLYFRSLTAGSGISLSGSSNEINIKLSNGFVHSYELAAYALTSALNATGAALAAEIDILQAATGSYATTGFVNDNYVRRSGDETISGVKNFVDRTTFSSGLYANGSDNSTSVDSLNWQLSYGGGTKIDWGANVINDNYFARSISWSSRRLYSGSSDVRLDWNNCILSTGALVTSLNWANKILSGSWITNTTPTSEYHIINKGYLDTATGTLYPASNPSGYIPSGNITGVGNVFVTSNGNMLLISGSGAAGAGEANTASNLGAGSGIFSSKDSVDLRFRSLVAGSGIGISGSSSELRIDFTGIRSSAGMSIGIGDGVSIIATGTSVQFVPTFSFYPTGWIVLSANTGSLQVGISGGLYDNYPTMASIAGTQLPFLSGAMKNITGDLSTWSPIISGGCPYGLSVQSVSGVRKASVTIMGYRL